MPVYFVHPVCCRLSCQAERRVQEQRTRKGTQPFFIGGRSRDAQEEEEEEQEDPRAARARAQAERRAAQEQAKQEAAAARSADQVGAEEGQGRKAYAACIPEQSG
jgi:hypothetical protein